MSRLVVNAAMVIGGGLLALLVGGWIALAGLYGAFLLAALGAVALALLLPWSWLLWSLLAIVFALVGPLQYFAGVDKAFWLPYLMAIIIGVRALGEARPGGNASAPASPDEVRASGPGLWSLRLGLAMLALWASAMVLASLIHRVSPIQWVVAGKEYLFLWALPLSFALGVMTLEMIGSLWRWATVWLVLQVPVVAWQRWIIAPQRGGDSPWDAVVGLFAGRATGGGGSGTMALVSLWAAGMVAMAWRQGRCHGGWALAAVGSALAACAMAEVKIAVAVAPLMALAVALLVSLQGGHIRHLGTSLGVMVAGLALSGLLLLAHQQQFASRRSAEGQSVSQYLQTMLARNLDDRSLADPHGQLTRLGALRLWWQQQQAQDVPGWLMGHGIGAARRSHLFVGSAARPWRMDIGRSSAVILLWETGVLGLVSWTAGMAALAASAWRLAPGSTEPWLLRSAAAIMVISLLSLPYGADLFESPHLSTALMLGVGITLAAASGSIAGKGGRAREVGA